MFDGDPKWLPRLITRYRGCILEIVAGESPCSGLRIFMTVAAHLFLPFCPNVSLTSSPPSGRIVKNAYEVSAPMFCSFVTLWCRKRESTYIKTLVKGKDLLFFLSLASLSACTASVSMETDAISQHHIPQRAQLKVFLFKMLLPAKCDALCSSVREWRFSWVLASLWLNHEGKAAAAKLLRGKKK